MSWVNKNTPHTSTADMANVTTMHTEKTLRARFTSPLPRFEAHSTCVPSVKRPLNAVTRLVTGAARV